MTAYLTVKEIQIFSPIPQNVLRGVRNKSTSRARICAKINHWDGHPNFPSRDRNDLEAPERAGAQGDGRGWAQGGIDFLGRWPYAPFSSCRVPGTPRYSTYCVIGCVMAETRCETVASNALSMRRNLLKRRLVCCIMESSRL